MIRIVFKSTGDKCKTNATKWIHYLFTDIKYSNGSGNKNIISKYYKPACQLFLIMTKNLIQFIHNFPLHMLEFVDIVKAKAASYEIKEE